MAELYLIHNDTPVYIINKEPNVSITLLLRFPVTSSLGHYCKILHSPVKDYRLSPSAFDTLLALNRNQTRVVDFSNILMTVFEPYFVDIFLFKSVEEVEFRPA